MKKVKFSKWAILTLIVMVFVVPFIIYYITTFAKNQQLTFSSNDTLQLTALTIGIFWITAFCVLLIFRNHDLLKKLFVVTERNNELVVENNTLLKQVIKQNELHSKRNEYQYDNLIKQNMDVKEMIIDSIDIKDNNIVA